MQLNIFQLEELAAYGFAVTGWAATHGGGVGPGSGTVVVSGPHDFLLDGAEGFHQTLEHRVCDGLPRGDELGCSQAIERAGGGGAVGIGLAARSALSSEAIGDRGAWWRSEAATGRAGRWSALGADRGGCNPRAGAGSGQPGSSSNAEETASMRASVGYPLVAEDVAHEPNDGLTDGVAVCVVDQGVAGHDGQVQSLTGEPMAELGEHCPAVHQLGDLG